MEEKIARIKEWLGTGSINIFGLPMSGKDTQGIRLAEMLGAKFLSSGMIIRAAEAETHRDLTGNGKLVPTNLFYDLVLPYFGRSDLADFPLILSSIGRWYGEETSVIEMASATDHPIKAAVLLNISEADVMDRFETAKILNDRGDRNDDKEASIFYTRIQEFTEKTLPVLQHYKELGLLTEVRGDQTRDEVFLAMIDALYQKTFEA